MVHSKRPARLQRRGQGAIIQYIKRATNRHALRKPRDGNTTRLQPIGHIMRSRRPFHRCGQGQNHLRHIALFNPYKQRLDRLIFRPCTGKCGEHPTQHMIKPVMRMGAFQGP